MKHLILSLLALAFLAVTGEAQSVSLPAQLRGEVGAWIHIKPSKVDGGAPKWRLDPELEEIAPESFLPPEIAKAFIGKLVRGPQGKFRIEAWNAKADVASEIATTWIIIGKGTPGPPPVDPPPAGPKAKSLTFVVIGSPEKTATVTEDEPFQAWLRANGIGIYGIMTKAQQDANPNFKGVISPAIALQGADNKLIAWSSIGHNNVAAAKAFVVPYIGK